LKQVRHAAWLAVSGLALSLLAPGPLRSQAPAEGGPATCEDRAFVPMPGSYRSVEVQDDGRITFRLCAPGASSVSVVSSDVAEVIPTGFGGGPAGLRMTLDSTGLWTVTTPAPVEVDAFRFNFAVDGVTAPDPKGQTFSRTYVGLRSTVDVGRPEGAFQAYDPAVPHGVVSTIEYWSTSLQTKRLAMVYTPPGYMRDNQAYPVLYLVHGAGDSEDSWTSIGHANYILDNLIAAGRAEPMIVVMPAGHTPPRAGVDMLVNEDFSADFLNDLIPFVEANFRTIDDTSSRAMAGLSMGGAHTLANGLTHPELFAYVGVFSMGLMNQEQVEAYEENYQDALREAGQTMELVYYAMGESDFLYDSVEPTRRVFAKYGIDHVYNESGGGHTWINWRAYLADFLPRLFARR
jgi:enterochelin esterase-like enzyme